MEESVGAEDVEFKWGKKKGVGKNKDFQFYESFTYDGDEYNLYDFVLVSGASEPDSTGVSEPDSTEPFVGMIIKIWESSNKRSNFQRNVKLLWFFKPSEISLYLEGVRGILPNELFLASGEGVGLADINPLEVIGGKCSVLCISKDERNPQPTDEEIKSADFVFRRAFNVGSCKVLDTIDDNIAGVDVKFIFNKAGSKNEATAVQKIEAAINGKPDSLKPNGFSAMKSAHTSFKPSGCKEGKEKNQNQLDTEKSRLAEERSNKDSGVQEGTVRNEHDAPEAPDSRKNQNQLATKKSRLAEERSNKDSGIQEGTVRNEHDAREAPDSRKNHNQLATKKSRLAEERSKDSGLQEGTVRREHDAREAPDSRKNHNQLATKKSSLAKERSNKDSCVQEGTVRTEHDAREATDSRKNHCDAKVQESEVKKQKSMPAEKRNSNSCEASGSNGEKQLTKQKSMPPEASNSKYSNGLDDRPQKKQKLDGSITVPDGRNTNTLPNASSAGKKDTECFKRPKDKVPGDGVPTEKPSFGKKKQDLGHKVSEGKDVRTATEKGLSKKHSFDGKYLKRAEEKVLAVDIERNYQVIEVTRRPDAVNSTWYQPNNLPFEESMREAENQERLVLLQNLDPTYTSDEVQDLVYSALNEQCTARMIECTSVAIDHTGQALVIFKSKEAAERAIKRLDKGCLLLSNGCPLVAAFAKINPPGKPPSFTGHIKPYKTQMRREARDAVATSHSSQPNTIEYEMAMEWHVRRARSDYVIEEVSKLQSDEKRRLQINLEPKLP